MVFCHSSWQNNFLLNRKQFYTSIPFWIVYYIYIKKNMEFCVKYTQLTKNPIIKATSAFIFLYKYNKSFYKASV